MTQEQRTHEQRVRRMAKRQGLDVKKNGMRDPRAIGYGRVQLVARDVPGGRWRPGEVVAEVQGLDGAEAWLRGDQQPAT